MADGHDARYSDAANRCSDVIRLHIVGGSAGKWAAVRLSDGWSDGTPYDTKADSVRLGALKHPPHDEFLFCYVCIPPDDMSPRQAELFLRFNRELHANGMRMTDPADDRANASMPTTIENLRRLGVVLPSHVQSSRSQFRMPPARRFL